jgi:hypothetical protein
LDELRVNIRCRVISQHLPNGGEHKFVVGAHLFREGIRQGLDLEMAFVLIAFGIDTRIGILEFDVEQLPVSRNQVLAFDTTLCNV